MTRFFEPICEFGDFQAKTATKAVQVVTAQFTIPQGRKALVSLRQGVKTDPAGSSLDRIVAGLSWQLFLAEVRPDGLRNDFRIVPLRKTQSDGTISWTFTGDQPVVRNIVLEAQGNLNTIQWCATMVDTGALPASVLGVYGAIEGFLLPREMPDRDLLALLRQP